MFGIAIAAAAGAIIGGVANGITTAMQTKKLAKAYREAADQMKEATEKYSGKNLYGAMKTAGNQMADTYARNAQQAFTNTANPGQTNNMMALAKQNMDATAQNTNDAAQSGRQLGQNLKKSDYDAKYNTETVAAQQALKQAGIDYNVANQATQSITGGLADLANTYSNIAGGVSRSKNSGNLTDRGYPSSR